MAAVAGRRFGILERVGIGKGNKGQSPYRDKFVAWIWIGPAVVFVAVFLVWPVLNTIWLSFFNSDSSEFVALKNFKTIFTDPTMLTVLRNNLLWLVLGTAATVFLGLVIAVLADRVRIESVAKAAIFIPMAISFVGAGVIWDFMYAYANSNQQQIGLLNAIVTRLGFPPQAWLINSPGNNIALIVIYVWIWTGFCMVILSAALKSIPADILEAARVDGANELAIFFRVTVPMIMPTIVVVATTMVINLLKIFDILYVTTSGNYGTNVIALQYVQELFKFNNFGLASALAVVLLAAIIPIMYFNIKRFRTEGQR
ncbi:MAG TPA: sugar ABC transporter permease [Ktedonobacterales bacterium]|nr:sugar ABC transporter permease [Ktedonobacterales bacterium]